MNELIVDTSNPREFNMAMTALRGLEGSGKQRITWVRFRDRRSDAQNAYFWAAVFPPIYEWCRAAGNEWTNEYTYSYLKGLFASEQIIDKITGEFVTIVRDTSDMDTLEYSNFIERCCKFAAETCEIVIPPATRG